MTDRKSVTREDIEQMPNPFDESSEFVTEFQAAFGFEKGRAAMLAIFDALPATPPPSGDVCVFCDNEATTETDGTPRCEDHRYASEPPSGDVEAAREALLQIHPRPADRRHAVERFEAAIRAESGGLWHNDGDACTGLHCGNPEHGWSEVESGGLDAHALSMALWDTTQGRLDAPGRYADSNKWAEDILARLTEDADA